MQRMQAAVEAERARHPDDDAEPANPEQAGPANAAATGTGQADRRSSPFRRTRSDRDAGPPGGTGHPAAREQPAAEAGPGQSPPAGGGPIQVLHETPGARARPVPAPGQAGPSRDAPTVSSARQTDAVTPPDGPPAAATPRGQLISGTMPPPVVPDDAPAAPLAERPASGLAEPRPPGEPRRPAQPQPRAGPQKAPAGPAAGTPPAPPRPPARPGSGLTRPPGRPGQVRHLPASRPSRRGSRIAAFTAAVVVVLAAGTAAVILAKHGGDAAPGANATTSTAGLAAATWVDRQVSHDAVVACDPVMCSTLRRQGFPAGRLQPIKTSSSYPVHAAVVVETPIVQQQFGNSLATNVAPEILATFGSGRAQISIRIIATGGAAAYRSRLAKDAQQRKTAGRNLLSSRSVHAAAAAKQQILAGLVDMRLLVLLTALADREGKVDIASFGPPAAGASQNLPLRSVFLGIGGPAYVRSLRQVVDTQPVPFRRAFDGLVPAGQKTLLKVVFSAPSPLELGTS
ncbi:MAG TPA: hypothetical protein VF843_09580 [Streptosporangiaceae bacterium]